MDNSLSRYLGYLREGVLLTYRKNMINIVADNNRLWKCNFCSSLFSITHIVMWICNFFDQKIDPLSPPFQSKLAWCLA